MFIQIKRIYIYFYFLCAIGAPVVFLIPSIQSGAQRSSLFMLIWVAMYVITIGILLCHKRIVDRRSIYIFLLPVLFVISVLWSQMPIGSLQYALSYFLNVLAAVIVVRTIPMEEFPRYLGRFLLFACALSFALFVIGFDGVKYTDVHNRPTLLGTTPMRGLFNHKITAGIGGAVAFLLLFYTERGMSRICALCFLLLFILMTGSSLALAALVVSLSMHPILAIIRKTPHRGFTLVIFLLLLTLACVVLFKLVGGPILELLGRDATLTGRTLLWGWGLEVFLEKPILGWGYQGYNGSQIAEAAARNFKEFFYYDVPHFHNSFIQLLVEVGLVGFSIFLGLLIFTVQFWTGNAQNKRNSKAVLSLLFFLLFACFFMNQMHLYNNLNSMIITTLALYAMRHSKDSLSLRMLKTQENQPIAMQRTLP